MKYTKHIWGLLTGFFFCVSVFAQSTDRTAKYRIRVLGINIGEFTVNQKAENGEISTEAITNVKVKIIFTYKVKYVQQSLYRQGNLWSSHVKTIKDGKVNSDTWLEKRGKTYLLVSDGDSTFIDEHITYSGSLLYFYEPKDVPYMYKERNGEKNYIKCIAAHTYAATDDKGRETNEYEYEDGILEKAVLKHSIATIYMERIR